MSDEMTLYLMRHGEALPESEDPSQPLSARGRVEVERIARHLAEVGLQIAHIGHSGKLRARETAELLSERLLATKAAHQVDGLAPMSDPQDACERAEKLHEATIWVGHLPHLDRLVSQLLLRETGRHVLQFAPGTIACLVRTDTGWRLRWVLTPELAKRRF